MTWTLHEGDCLEVMKQMASGCVDLVVTSPPYNLGNEHHTGNKRHKAYNDSMPEEEYQSWQTEVLSEIFRILTDEGSLLYNHKNRIKNGKQITPYEWLLKTPFTIKQEIVWITRSQNFDKIRFYPWTERVYWLTKNPFVKMNNVLNHHDVFDYTEWKPVGTKGEHTRAFPLKMAEDLIRCFPEAVTIFDPFAGSGTTGEAAERTGRNSVLIEKEPKYCEIIRKRLTGLQIQQALL